MKRLSILILFFVLNTTICTELLGQQRQFARYIHKSDGLLSRDVLAVAEVADGRFWIGTAGGLQLYDGNHFLSLNDLSGSDPIGNQRVLNLIYTEDAKLYVFVYNNVFAINTKTYDCVEYNFPNHSDGELILFKIIEDTHYWAILYDDHTKLFSDENDQLNLVDSVKYERLLGTTHNLELINGILLWSAGSFGIRIINAKTKALIKHQFNLAFGYPCTIEADGDVWCVGGDGIYKMNYPYSSGFEFFNKGPDMKFYNISTYKEGEIWALGRGIYKIHENGNIENYNWISENLDIDIYNNLFEDTKGNKWVTTKGGLVIIFEKADAFKVLLNDQSQKPLSEFRGIISPDSDEILAYPEGNFGTLYRENIKTGKRDTLSVKDEKGNDLKQYYSYLPLIYDERFDAYWVMEIEGFGLFDANELVFTKILDKKTGCFTLLDNGKILIGRRVDDLVLFDPETKEVNEIPVDFENKGEIGHINSIFQVDENSVMICGLDGLFNIDLSGQILNRFNTESTPSLPHSSVSMIQQDADGNFWGGTKGGGVFSLSADFKKVEHYGIESGLPNLFVPTVLLIDAQNVLAATYYGMSIINIAEKKVTNYFESNGISHNEFNTNSYLQKDSILYLGTLNGINAINNKEVLLDLEKPKLFLSRISVFNSTEDSIRNYNTIENKLEIDHSDTWFEVDFGITDLINPDYNIYRYKLNGFHEQWQTLIGEGTLKFEGIPAGSYSLEIQGSNPSNVACGNTLLLDIEINEVFFKSKWFLLSCLLFLSLVIYFWYYRIKNENRRLEKTVLERTKQITEDKEIIEKQSQELTSLDELKNEFFANISHELRTPLTLIMSPMQQIFKSKKIGEKERQLLSLMHDNGKLLQDRIDEMLELSRLVSSEVKLSYESVLLHNLIDFSTRIFKAKCADKNILFNIEQINTEVYVLCDEKRLSKVIQNLVNNAIKFTNANGIVDCKFEYNNGQFVFTIADDGIGIEPSQVNKVFDRYYQIKKNKNADKLGSGIGLSIVKEYIELMNGSVVVASQLNVGSSFKTSIPLTVSDELFEHDVLFENIITDFQFVSSKGKPKLLLVEDNSDLRAFMKSLLVQYFDIVEAEDGLLAFEKLQSINVDIILSDIMMPNMNGMELLDLVRKDTHKKIIPFVFLTAKHNKKDILNAYKIGVDDYLTKPFLEEELLHRLKAVYQNYISRINISQNASSIFAQPILEETSSAFIKQFDDLIRQNISSHDFTIDGIASKLEVSRRHLIRLVKKEVGLTPSSYIKEIKLNMARTYKETREYKTVAEVSKAVGFTTTKYFEKLYFDRFGSNWS